jgi:hypothetical protein
MLFFSPRNYARNQEDAGIEEAGLVQSRHEAGRDEGLSSQKSARRAFQLRPRALKTRRAAPQARPAAGFFLIEARGNFKLRGLELCQVTAGCHCQRASEVFRRELPGPRKRLEPASSSAERTQGRGARCVRLPQRVHRLGSKGAIP